MEIIAVRNDIAEEVEDFMYENGIEFSIVNIDEVKKGKGNWTVYGVERWLDRYNIKQHVYMLVDQKKERGESKSNSYITALRKERQSGKEKDE